MDLSAKHEAKYQYWRKYLFKNNKVLYKTMLEYCGWNIRKKSQHDKILQIVAILNNRNPCPMGNLSDFHKNQHIKFLKAKEIVMYKNNLPYTY